MYLSASHIDVKRNQDYADFADNDDYQALILCDGIGEFDDSGKFSNLVVNQCIEKHYSTIKELLLDNEILGIKDKTIEGGTTILFARCEKNNDLLKIEYLGNGGIIHFSGDFATNQNTELPYRYAEIMLPHVSPDGALRRHFSHNSGKAELEICDISLKLNHPCGDIIVFFTDGISSLEDKVILQDSEGRFWRNESPTIQNILSELNLFLNANKSNEFQEALNQFAKFVLNKLKNNNLLEDDASLGIIITKEVIDYYNSLPA
jgi:serine/threonine protein phosphatase PrpC